MYDGTGKLTNWWSNSSAQHFEKSTQCMVRFAVEHARSLTAPAGR